MLCVVRVRARPSLSRPRCPQTEPLSPARPGRARAVPHSRARCGPTAGTGPGSRAGARWCASAASSMSTIYEITVVSADEAQARVKPSGVLWQRGGAPGARAVRVDSRERRLARERRGRQRAREGGPRYARRTLSASLDAAKRTPRARSISRGLPCGRSTCFSPGRRRLPTSRRCANRSTW